MEYLHHKSELKLTDTKKYIGIYFNLKIDHILAFNRQLNMGP